MYRFSRGVHYFVFRLARWWFYAALFGLFLHAGHAYSADVYFNGETFAVNRYNGTGSWTTSTRNLAGPYPSSYTVFPVGQEQVVCEDIANLYFPEMTSNFSMNPVSLRAFESSIDAFGHLDFCVFQFWEDAIQDPVTSPFVYISFQVVQHNCPDGIVPATDSFGMYSCESEVIYTNCPDWGNADVSISGFFPLQITEPAAYCHILTNSNGGIEYDQCRWDRVVTESIYEDGILVGHDIVLTSTQDECPDESPLVFVDQLLPARGEPEIEPPEITEGGGAVDRGNDPFQPPPDYGQFPDPENITDQTELLQEILRVDQDTHNVERESGVALDDINKELNYQTDLLSNMANAMRETKRLATVDFGDCGIQPHCSGDAIDCALLHEAWLARCENWEEEQTNAGAWEGYMELEGDEFLAGEEIDLQQHFDIQPRYGAPVCPSPETFTVYGSELSISYQHMCDFAPSIRPWVILCGYLTAAFIVFGRSFT